MARFVSVSAGLLLTCTLVGGVGAQDSLYVLYTFESPNPANGGWFGWNCEGLGDVNNDGYEDIGVAATYEDPGGIANAGRAYVFSGETAETLYTLVSPNAQTNGEFGWIGGLGDVNDDGHDDFVVTAWREMVGGLWNAGRAYVYSGATGDTLYSLESPAIEQNGRFGNEAAGAGDVDNDGYPDVAVGASREDHVEVDAGKVHLFSGATGALVWTLVSPFPCQGGGFGETVVNAGDVDWDGTDDLVVSAGAEDPWGIPNAGMAYVFSGATGDTLYSLWPPDVQEGGYFGWPATGAGDVDGDGYADVIAGACGLDVGGEVNVGRSYVFSGATGDTLYALDSPNPNVGGRFGRANWGGEDYDQDGYADVVVGAPSEDPAGIANAGRAYVFSGVTGQLMVELTSPMPEADGQFGYWLGEGADANGDGKVEVIVAAPLEDGGASNAGRVYVFSQMLLAGSLSGGALVLDWTYWPAATEYWVYGADNEAYFVPGLTLPFQQRLAVLPVATTTWSSANGVGDPDHNWTYLVIAVDAAEQELCRSNRVGEFDFSTGD